MMPCAAAEMADLREGVAALRQALDALVANAAPAQDAVLRLNVREARLSLGRRVQQLSAASAAALVRGLPPVRTRGCTQAHTPQRLTW